MNKVSYKIEFLLSERHRILQGFLDRDFVIYPTFQKKKNGKGPDRAYAQLSHSYEPLTCEVTRFGLLQMT